MCSNESFVTGEFRKMCMEVVFSVIKIYNKNEKTLIVSALQVKIIINLKSNVKYFICLALS